MNHQWIFLSKAVSKTLAVALAIQLAGFTAAAQSLPAVLNVVVVQGEGASNRVRERAVRDPAIRVVDEKQAPVTGAAVVFTLPTEGATGVFGNGSKTLTTLTDARGDAVAQGLRFNQVPGKVPVHVNVSYRGLTAHTNIMQIVVAPAGYKAGGGGKGKLIAIFAVLGAAGAGGAFYAMRKSGTTTPAAAPASTAIGITAGTGTVAPPH
jgi:hypothetical protein